MRPLKMMSEVIVAIETLKDANMVVDSLKWES